MPWEITSSSAFSSNSIETRTQSTSPLQFVGNGEDKDILKEAASRAEYETIMTALRQVNFNKKKAAELLKIDRKTLYNKIKNFQLLDKC